MVSTASSRVPIDRDDHGGIGKQLMRSMVSASFRPIACPFSGRLRRCNHFRSPPAQSSPEPAPVMIGARRSFRVAPRPPQPRAVHHHWAIKAFMARTIWGESANINVFFVAYQAHEYIPLTGHIRDRPRSWRPRHRLRMKSARFEWLISHILELIHRFQAFSYAL